MSKFGSSSSGVLSAISGTTLIVPHLAFPAEHLRTSTFFNPRCRELGIDAVLVPWAVAPNDLATVWAALRLTHNVPGVVVTLPHKAAVAELCDIRVGAAATLGVANVARRQPDNTFVGDMLDGVAFVAGLENEGHAVMGRHALMVGAGGAATAIALALAESGVASLTIANRSNSKAEALAQIVARLCPKVMVAAGALDGTAKDLIVNATSLGMRPDDPLPLPIETISPDSLVAEVVMNPDMTHLLVEAQRKGASIHRGVHMIQAQIDALIACIFGPVPSAKASSLPLPTEIA